MSNTEKQPNPVARGKNFLDDSWDELKKVHTPSKQETIQATIVVMTMIVVFSVFLGLADYIVGNVMQAILT